MHRLVRYNQVTASSGGGPDVAEMFDTRFRDTFSGWPEESQFKAGRFVYLVQGFPAVRVNGDGVTGDEDRDTGYLYPRLADTVREREDDWRVSGEGYSIEFEKSFGNVVIRYGSISQSALAAPDEFSPQALSDRDFAILAHGLVRQGGTSGESDEVEAAVDSVLRTEFWWSPR
jgi:hypothetical protein